MRRIPVLLFLSPGVRHSMISTTGAQQDNNNSGDPFRNNLEDFDKELLDEKRRELLEDKKRNQIIEGMSSEMKPKEIDPELRRQWADPGFYPVPKELVDKAVTKKEAIEVLEGSKEYVAKSFFPYDLEAMANEAMLTWISQYRNQFNETEYQSQISEYLDNAESLINLGNRGERKHRIYYDLDGNIYESNRNIQDGADDDSANNNILYSQGKGGKLVLKDIINNASYKFNISNFTDDELESEFCRRHRSRIQRHRQHDVDEMSGWIHDNNGRYSRDGNNWIYVYSNFTNFHTNFFRGIYYWYQNQTYIGQSDNPNLIPIHRQEGGVDHHSEDVEGSSCSSSDHGRSFYDEYDVDSIRSKCTNQTKGDRKCKDDDSDCNEKRRDGKSGMLKRIQEIEKSRDLDYYNFVVEWYRRKRKEIRPPDADHEKNTTSENDEVTRTKEKNRGSMSTIRLPKCGNLRGRGAEFSLMSFVLIVILVWSYVAVFTTYLTRVPVQGLVEAKKVEFTNKRNRVQRRRTVQIGD